MTEAVAAPANIIDGSANLPPPNLKAGFVPPVGNGGDPAPEPKAAPAPQGLDTAIAALTAALAAQNGTPTAAPAAEAPGAALIPAGGLNELDASTLEDPILRSMATVMQTVGKGLDMDRVFSKAIEHGNPDLLDIAYLKEKGGENAPQLITIAQGIIQAIEAQSAKVTQDVYALAGGEQQWTTSIAAFNQVAPLELRTVVGTMLDSGKVSQIQAGAKLIVEYAKKSGVVPVVNPLLNSGSAVTATGQALGKSDFQDALQKLDPQSKTYQNERNELFARRQMGKNLGMK